MEDRIQELEAGIVAGDAVYAVKFLTREGFMEWFEGKEDLTLVDFKPEVMEK